MLKPHDFLHLQIILARFLFGFILVANGLNWWWKILPYPSLHDPPLARTPHFVQALIDTGFMFDVVRVLELIVGAMLLSDSWVALALVIVFPVTLAIWSVDIFLIQANIRAQIMGWSVFSLNIFLLLSYLDHYLPMLSYKATSPRMSSYRRSLRP